MYNERIFTLGGAQFTRRTHKLHATCLPPNKDLSEEDKSTDVAKPLQWPPDLELDAGAPFRCVGEPHACAFTPRMKHQ